MNLVLDLPSFSSSLQSLLEFLPACFPVIVSADLLSNFILADSLLSVYRYVFSSWTFFATITVTALILLIGTTALGTICRLNFGQGLAHYRKLFVIFLRLDLKLISPILQFKSVKRWSRSTLHQPTLILAIVAAILRNLFTVT